MVYSMYSVLYIYSTYSTHVQNVTHVDLVNAVQYNVWMCVGTLCMHSLFRALGVESVSEDQTHPGYIERVLS